MPDRPLTTCQYGGCRAAIPAGQRFCSQHGKAVAEARDDRYRKDDPLRKAEMKQDWRNVSAVMRHRNPICQAIIDGWRCNKPSEVVHHLIDPRQHPELMYDWANLVAVCKPHHPGGQAGDLGRGNYAPTIGFFNEEYRHDLPGKDSAGQPKSLEQAAMDELFGGEK